MRLFCFAAGQSNLPHAANPDRAALGLERWRQAVAQTADSGLADFAEAITRDADGRRLLEAVFGNSPYLTLSAVKDPGFLRQLLTEGPDAACAGVMTGLKRAGNDGLDGDGLARDLRVAKRRVALAVAMADITGAWSLERVTGTLSDFAELALGGAADFVALKEKVAATAVCIHRHFADLIETPAQAVADRRPSDSGPRQPGPQNANIT